ncbi:MAG: hypothetical protein HYY06_32810 [Deltaproteobacteria bacterium]|nr:hypothetical protein [Deltaproteobacteria bacterium]
MQGRWTKRGGSAVVQTECGCGSCHEPIRIETDGERHAQVLEGGPSPLVFAPLADPRRSGQPSIIDVF